MEFDLKRFCDTRVDSDLSQKQMAKIINVSEDMYKNYENKRTDLPVEKAIEFANYFELSLNYLLNLSNNKHLSSKVKFNSKIISERLANIRKQEKASQELFGQSINIPQRTYASYENNERPIPLEVLYNIAFVKNISIDYLTGRSNNQKIIN